MDKLWAEAELHEDGAGLRDGGPDWTVAQAALAAKRRAGDAEGCGMLHAVFQGACWSEERRHRCGYRLTPVCR
eukprot:10344509-Lingulodinium_polyedra.AAC.1